MSSPRRAMAAAAAAFFVAGAGWFGYYDSALWGPIALVALGLATGIIAAGQAPRTGPELAAIGALTLMWPWALASRSWAESADQALLEANRWALYAATLAVLVMVVRRNGWSGTAFVAVGAAGVAAISLFVVLELATGSGH